MLLHLEADWEEFAGSILTHLRIERGSKQWVDQRRAFLSGCITMFRKLQDVADSKPDQVEFMLRTLGDEVNRFCMEQMMALPPCDDPECPACKAVNEAKRLMDNQ